MKKLLGLLAMALLLIVGLTSGTEKRKLHIFMVGDSTMANKKLDDNNLERGWGQMLSGFFTDDVVIDNHAVNGRSSLSFINEGKWEKVLQKIRPGDYVIIQFGHNDEKPKEDRHTEPGSTFDANLRQFCKETRMKGGIPVLMNAIVRRKFYVDKNAVTDDDKFGQGTTVKQDGDSLVETHILTRPDGSKADYLAAPRNVAREMGVTFIDMNRISKEIVQSLGAEKSKELFCWIPAGTNAAAPKGRQDDTHLQVRGARLMARKAAEAMFVQIPGLRPFIRYYDYVVAKDGSGDFFTVQEAFNAVPDNSKQETTILIAPGTYKEKLVLDKKKINVHIIARTEHEAILTYDDYAAKIDTATNKEIGTTGSASFTVNAAGFSADGIVFQNSASNEIFAKNRSVMGQAVAILTKGDKMVFRRCKFLGHQDTLYANSQKETESSRQYYEDCYIEGTVDYIFGRATAVFNRCEMHCLADGHVTAASTSQGFSYGYVFHDCKITSEANVKTDLGRPWRPYAQVVYLNCELTDQIQAEGWSEWSKNENHKTAYYAEYNSKGAGAKPDKRVSWSHQLTKEEAQKYDISKVLAGADNWNPAK